jgi:hypothetical protein
MPGLFENAVESIKLGVEDYLANEPARALSAVRNFYSGLLLLAKEVLVRAAPDAEESEIIAARYKPVPDDSGGVKFIADSGQTIDLQTIGARFKDFGLSIDHAALRELSRIRNDIEHRYSKEPHDAVRQAIAKAFPVAAALFRLAGEEPREVLGKCWDTMLEVRAVYDQELNACRATYDKIQWSSHIFEEAAFVCPECQSDLVEQDDPDNADFQSAESHCRSCGAKISAEALIENAVAAHLEWQSYVAMTDGGDAPLQDCPECGLTTYLLTEEDTGCVWCDCKLGECAVCHVGLMPDNVDPDNHNLCDYHGHLWSKDD